eukprot:1160363-Pelagomonas_calceolata.AAC.4
MPTEFRPLLMECSAIYNLLLPLAIRPVTTQVHRTVHAQSCLLLSRWLVPPADSIVFSADLCLLSLCLFPCRPSQPSLLASKRYGVHGATQSVVLGRYAVSSIFRYIRLVLALHDGPSSLL